jgi:Ribbon-helix-helix protein, copG family.
MARPKKYKSAVRVTLYLDSEMAKILSHIARERGVSRSQLVSEILTEYISRHYKVDRERAEIEEYVTKEFSSLRSLVHSLIRYCKDTVCIKETMDRYRDAIMNKLVSIEALAVKYRVTVVLSEIEKLKNLINLYRDSETPQSP